MSYKQLTTLWTDGRRSCDIFYITGNEICFIAGSFVKILVTDGRELNFQENIHGTNCLAASYKLGVIAASDNHLKPTIHLAKYPKFDMLPMKLYDGSEGEYLRMAFVGKDYLMTIRGEPDFIITVWKWTTGSKLCTLPLVINVETPSNLRLSVCPSRDTCVCLQNSKELLFLELEELGCNIHISYRMWFTPVIGDNECLTSITERNLRALTIFDKTRSSSFGLHSDAVTSLPMTSLTDLPVSEMVELNDYMTGQRRFRTTCHSWLPSGNLVIACSGGKLLKVNYGNLDAAPFFDVSDMKNSLSDITAIAVNKEAVYVAERNGLVWKLLEVENEVKVLEIINMKVLIRNFVFSPDYRTLAIMSVNGSVFLHDTKDTKHSTYCLVEGRDFSPVVGICTPFASHCVVGRRNGLLEAWAIDYGVLTSKFRLNMEIECLEGSPLCSVVLVGSSTGYVFVIDATDITALRAIKIFKAFDTPLLHIRYENFGRYVALASVDEGVIIMNGVPTSQMPMLGIWKAKDIVDICLFTKDLKEEMLLVILKKSASCEVSNAGSVLIRVALPNNFYRDYSSFWEDGVAVLNETLWSQTMNLAYPGVALKVHCVLGALIFTANRHSIQIVFLGSNCLPDCLEPEAEILTPHENNNCHLILDVSHNWMASFGEDGKIFLYHIRNLETRYVAVSLHSYRTRGITSACFSHVKPVLITGGGDGSLACEAWQAPKSLETTIFTPWTAHCWSLKKEQNSCISFMEQQNLKEMSSWSSMIAEVENKKLIITMKAEKHHLVDDTALMYNKLSDLVSKNNLLPLEFQLSTKELILDESIYKKMLKQRSKILLCVRYELRSKLETLKEEAFRLKSKYIENIITSKKMVKSLRKGKKLFNFSIGERQREDILSVTHILKKRYLLFGKKYQLNHSGETDQESNVAFTEKDHSLFDPFELKTREQKVDNVAILKDLIHKRKIKFNKKFDELVKFKRSQKLLILEKIARFRFLLSVLDVETGVFEPDWSEEEGLEDLSDQPDNDRMYGVNAKRKHKRVFQVEKSDSDQKLSRSFMVAKLNSLIAPRDENEKKILDEMVKPDFMEEVPKEHWTHSETEIAKYFSGKLEAHQKRKLKYAATLQDELVEVKKSIDELVDAFDSSHQDLVTEKLECDFFIHLKEFSIAVILFTIVIDEQFKAWEKCIKDNISDKKKLLSSVDLFVAHAEKAVISSTWKKAQMLVRDKQMNKTIKQMKCERRHFLALMAAAKKRPETLTIKSELDPYEREEEIYTKNEVRKLLKSLDSDENRPEKVLISDWKRMCHLRMQKFTSEQKVASQTKSAEKFKMSLSVGQTRKEVLLKEIQELRDYLNILHRRRLLCINDLPQVMEVKYSNLEMGNTETLTSPCLVLQRTLVDECSQKAGEAKNMLLSSIKDGAQVRTELKIAFIEYKRLNIKMQECRRKMKLLEEIPMSKELKAVLAAGVINPYAKAKAIQLSAEHEKRELQRQIVQSEAEEKKTEREIVKEVFQYKSLEKRIKKVQDDLAQLKRLSEQD